MRQTVLVSISSRIGWIDAIEGLARDCGALLGFEESHCFDIALAVREAVSNAVTHGNNTDCTKQVWLEIGLDTDSLSFSVRDEGAGFRVEDIPDPTKPENLLKSSGRGVFYISKLMDEVDFSRTSRKGGAFVMVKRRVGHTPEDR